MHSIVAAHLFVVGQGARLDLRNLTVSGGSSTSADQFGGLIFNEGGTLVVTDSTISGNSSALRGGGIFNAEGGLVEVSGYTISGNRAEPFRDVLDPPPPTHPCESRAQSARDRSPRRAIFAGLDGQRR